MGSSSSLLASETSKLLQNIRLIDFDDFVALGTFPRYPENKDIVVTLQDFTIETYHKSLIVFISHCWLRGWDGAAGWDGRPHPDNTSGDKFKLCVEGIKYVKSVMAPGMEKCYIWLDFGCIDQNGNPAGELKMLDKIVQMSDCIFSPMFDEHPEAWDLPLSITNMYVQYASPSWIGTPHSYLNRGWCRVEMFYAANIPLFTPAGEETPTQPRHTNFSPGFAFHAKAGRRPHIVFGSYEVHRNYSPFIMPPLQNSWFEDYHPQRGYLSVPADRITIARLVEELQPYLKTTKIGYEGEYNAHGERHGHGVLYLSKGDCYEGAFANGVYHGYGRYTFSDGDYYEGDHVQGQSHGRGKFVFGNGAYYEGDWVEGLKQGKGFYDYTEGNTYEGDWYEDCAHGKGRMVFGEGSVYEGDFVEDKRHGYGKQTGSDGTVKEGWWEQDRFLGNTAPISFNPENAQDKKNNDDELV